MKLAVNGAMGRMGQTLCRLVAASETTRLVAVAEREGADAGAIHAILARAGAESAAVVPSITLFETADAVIDFTSPEASVLLAEAAAKAGKIHIIGTTGFEAHHMVRLREAGKRARIVQSGNFSLGVNVLEVLVEQAARLLSDEYDIEVDEMHHALKKDAPSGTALMLARAAAKGRAVELDSHKVHYAEGMIGERTRGTIGMSVRRGGEVIGEHTVTLAGPGEVLELTHRAGNRDIFAHGALHAARWAMSQPPGFYSMRDVLGI